MNDSERAVLRFIRERAYKSLSTPKKAEIAKVCKISQSMVQRCIRSLETAGYMTVERKMHGGYESFVFDTASGERRTTPRLVSHNTVEIYRGAAYGATVIAFLSPHQREVAIAGLYGTQRYRNFDRSDVARVRNGYARAGS